MDDDGKEINAGSIYKDGRNCIKIYFFNNESGNYKAWSN